MRQSRAFLFLAIAIAATGFGCASRGQSTAPTIQISTPHARATVLRPDATSGLHRGSRFDASGIVTELSTPTAEFFGPWRDAAPPHSPHSPADPESVQGLAEEFDIDGPAGFAATPPGGAFIKIGVGKLIRPDDKPYFFNRPYAPAEIPPWRVHLRPSAVAFRQSLADPARGYVYDKTVELLPDRPALRIRRTLRNAGSLPLETVHYGHNFLTTNRQPPSPGWVLSFGSPPQLATPDGLRDAAQFRDGTLSMLRGLAAGETVFLKFIPSPTNPLTQIVRLAFADASAIEITHDHPPAFIHVYINARVFCPELFTRIKLQPGESFSWQTLYTLIPPASTTPRPQTPNR